MCRQKEGAAWSWRGGGGRGEERGDVIAEVGYDFWSSQGGRREGEKSARRRRRVPVHLARRRTERDARPAPSEQQGRVDVVHLRSTEPRLTCRAHLEKPFPLCNPLSGVIKSHEPVQAGGERRGSAEGPGTDPNAIGIEYVLPASRLCPREKSKAPFSGPAHNISSRRPSSKLRLRPPVESISLQAATKRRRHSPLTLDLRIAAAVRRSSPPAPRITLELELNDRGGQLWVERRRAGGGGREVQSGGGRDTVERTTERGRRLGVLEVEGAAPGKDRTDEYAGE
jgi:hypothetical protein